MGIFLHSSTEWSERGRRDLVGVAHSVRDGEKALLLCASGTVVGEGFFVSGDSWLLRAAEAVSFAVVLLA